MTISTGRISPGCLLSVRIASHHHVQEKHDQQHPDDYQDDAGKAALRHGPGFGFPSRRFEFPHKCDGITVLPAAMQESKLMMRKWMWLAPALVLGACRDKAPLPELLPETVANVWHRNSLRETPVSEAPDPVPRTSVNRLQTAGYEGPGKLEARVYELSSSAVGLDLVQRWRPSADTVFVNPGRYLVVVKWEKADRQALRDFMNELERRLAK
jgi:hypothetical protein